MHGRFIALALVLVLIALPVGAQFVSNSPRITGVSRVVYETHTAVGTDAGVAEKDLATYTLPAATLSQDGQAVRVTATGSFAATATVKTVKLYFAGTSLTANSTTGSPNNVAWSASYVVYRTGAATQEMTIDTSTVGAVTQAVLRAAPTGDTTTALVVKVTGQNGTANLNDIVLRTFAVEFLPIGSTTGGPGFLGGTLTGPIQWTGADTAAKWRLFEAPVVFNGVTDHVLSHQYNYSTSSAQDDAALPSQYFALESNYDDSLGHKYAEINWNVITPGKTHDRRFMYGLVDWTAANPTGSWTFWGASFSLQAYNNPANDTPTTYFSGSSVGQITLTSPAAQNSLMVLNTTDASGTPGSTTSYEWARAGVTKWRVQNAGGNADRFRIFEGGSSIQMELEQNSVGTNVAGAAEAFVSSSRGTGTGIDKAFWVNGGAMSTVSSATLHTLIGRHAFDAKKVLTNNSAIAIINATAAANLAVAVQIKYGIEVFNATDVQVESGQVTCLVLNKGGVFSGNTCTKFGNAQSVNSGTLVVTFAITAADPAVISVNANSSLATISTGYPRITYEVSNLTQQAVAIQ